MDVQQKILVVDDTPANLKAIQISLNKLDAEIITATSGNGALKLVLQHEFSLILLDVQMPDMDGFEVAEHLQHEHSTVNIPIIFVTAFSREDKNINQGYRSGAVDYLFKPLDSTVLLSKINVFLKLDKMTQTLETYKNELEGTVEKRTKELSAALKEAESANEAKMEFLANMTHEMRTPLHGILSFTRFGLKAMTKGEVGNLERYFDRIETNGVRLLGLVDNLLDLGKLEAGKMKLNMSQNDLQQLMESCIAELETNFYDNQLTVVWESIDCDTVTSCDAVLIKQVISNLLSNAIKFSEPDHSVFMGITEHQLESANNQLLSGILCSIRDQGVGVPENELDNIFAKFSQSSKTKTNAGGTGLGLAISDEIIHLHQGKIWAEQGEEKGTVFKFVIPYVKAVTPAS